jgi:hypothetical protein
MPAFTTNQRAPVKQLPISLSPKTTPSPSTMDQFSQFPRLNSALSTPPPRKWSPSVKPSSKWVGRNHTRPSKWTTLLPLASPTSPLSHEKPSPWISAYGGSAAKSLNNSSATTGIRAATTGKTTTPSTTHQSTTKPTDPSMLVQQPNCLEPLPLSGPALFIY